MGLEEGEARDAVLRTIDKFDKVGEEGVRQLLTTGRKDASGAFIDGVGLSEEQAGPVLAFLTSKSEVTSRDPCKPARVRLASSTTGQEGVARA